MTQAYDTVFETLYNLAIDIRANRDYSTFTNFHTNCREEAQKSINADICTTTMPGESPEGELGTVRIFARNFVNRSYAPAKEAAVKQWLGENLGDHTNIDSYIETLEQKQQFPGKDLVLTSVKQFVAHNEYLKQPILSWLKNKRKEWNEIKVDALNPDNLIRDVDVICKKQYTKIDGMGFALTANLFCDIGVRVFAKPDIHVKPIIGLIGLMEHDDRMIFKALVDIVKFESTRIPTYLCDVLSPDGLYPRHLDRLIYLIGSDNHGLSGGGKKAFSRKRRQLMIKSLSSSGIINSNYYEMTKSYLSSAVRR